MRKFERVHTRKVDRKVAKNRMSAKMRKLCKKVNSTLSPAQMKRYNHTVQIGDNDHRSYFSNNWKQYSFN